MSLLILPALYLDALLKHTDLGWPGIVIAAAGLIGLVVALLAAVRRPAWRLLWLILPAAVAQAYAEAVGIWRIGDHNESVTVSVFCAGFFGALALGAYLARGNLFALAGAAVFALAYGAIAYEASGFVFWTDLH